MTVPLISSASARFLCGQASRCKLLTSLLLVLISSFSGYTQNVGNWTFTGNLAGTGTSSNTVGNVSLGTSIGGGYYSGASVWYGETGWPAGGVDLNAYVQFSLTPIAGHELNLTDVVLALRRSTTGTPSGSGPRQWSLRSSLDGFTTDIATGTLTTNFVNYTVTLNTSFRHLYSTITFRIYGFDAFMSSGGLNRFVLDNISAHGITAVLPVAFSNTRVQRTTGNNKLVQWQAANIQGGTRFHVQRSVNGVDYTVVHSITENDDLHNKQYSYIDAFAGQLLYYRIEVTEPSGSKRLSPVVRLTDKAILQPAIEYVSVNGQAMLAGLQVPTADNYTLLLHSANGILVQKQSMHLAAGSNTVLIPVNNLPHGIYTVSLYNKELVDSKKVLY